MLPPWSSVAARGGGRQCLIELLPLGDEAFVEVGAARTEQVIRVDTLNGCGWFFTALTLR